MLSRLNSRELTAHDHWDYSLRIHAEYTRRGTSMATDPHELRQELFRKLESRIILSTDLIERLLTDSRLSKHVSNSGTIGALLRDVLQDASGRFT